jgi:hypothetical protein
MGFLLSNSVVSKNTFGAKTRKEEMKDLCVTIAEAELIAAVDGTKTMVAMRNYLISRKYPVDKMVLFQDKKPLNLLLIEC